MTNEKGRREMGDGRREKRDGRREMGKRKEKEKKKKRKDFPPGMTIAGSLSPIVAKIL